MPTVSAGGSASITVYDNGTLSVASNAGFASVAIAQTAGPAISESWGPGPFRKIYGPFKEGATATVSSQTADVDYDTAPISAAVQAAVSGAGKRTTRVATRLYLTDPKSALASVFQTWAGETAFTAAMLVDTETDFDAVSLLAVNTTAAPLVIGAAYAATPTQIASYAANLGNTGQFLFSGATTKTLAAAAAVTQPTFELSDPLPLSSTARTDGGTRPLLLLDVQYTTASDGSTAVPYWFRTGSEWGASVSAGNTNGRILGSTYLKGAIALASLPAMAATGNCLVFGFVYWTRGVPVKVVMANGDSITSGSALTTSQNGPWLMKACQSISTPTAPVEFMICGHPGQRETVYAPYGRSFMNGISTDKALAGAGVPTHLIYAAGTPNIGATFGASQAASMRQQLSLTVGTAVEKGIQTAIWTMVPWSATATTPTWTGSSATTFAAYNAALANWNVKLLNFNAAVSYPADPTMYQTTALGYTVNTGAADLKHLSDAGDTRIATGDSTLPGGLVAPWILST